MCVHGSVIVESGIVSSWERQVVFLRFSPFSSQFLHCFAFDKFSISVWRPGKMNWDLRENMVERIDGAVSVRLTHGVKPKLSTVLGVLV